MSDSRYFRVSPKFWSDAHHWSDDVRLVALYLLTCEHRNTEGLFRLPELYAVEDLGWDPERFRDAFGELIGMGFVEHDPDAKVVFIVNAMKYQRPDNRNQALGAARRIAELPRNRLEPSFLERLEPLPEDVRDALTEGLPKGFGDPIPEGDTNPQALALARTQPQSPLREDAPAWRQAVHDARQTMNGKASYDLLATYKQAGKQLLDDGAEPSSLIPLVVDYVEQLLGQRIDSKHRALVAKTVRRNGLISLAGWDKALGATESDSPRDRMAYAQGVINRMMEEVAS